MTDIDNLRTAAILLCSDMPEGHLPGGLGKRVKKGCGRHFVVWTQRTKGQWVCSNLLPDGSGKCGKRSRANLNGGGSRIVKRTGIPDREAARAVAEALDEGQRPSNEVYHGITDREVFEPTPLVEDW